MQPLKQNRVAVLRKSLNHFFRTSANYNIWEPMKEQGLVLRPLVVVDRFTVFVQFSTMRTPVFEAM